MAYGALGMIAGLLLENKALIFKQNVRADADKLKKKVKKMSAKAGVN